MDIQLHVVIALVLMMSLQCRVSSLLEGLNSPEKTLFQKIIDRQLKVPTFYLFKDEETAQNKKRLLQISSNFQTLSQKYNQNQLIFIECDFKGDYRCSNINFDILKVPNQMLPTLIFRKIDQKKYLYQDREINHHNFQKFMTSIDDGSLQQYLLSAPIPQSNDDIILRVVGSTYRQLIENSDKHILLKIYAPWSGHCKHLHPRFRAAAQTMQDVRNLIFAQMDGTQNEAAGVDVRGFPTVVYFGVDKSKGYISCEQRSAQKIVEWLKNKIEVKEQETPKINEL